MARVTKRCLKCGKRKRLDKFARNRSRPDGRQKWCKECQRQYRQEHRDEMIEYLHRYYVEHGDQVREQVRQNYQRHRSRELRRYKRRREGPLHDQILEQKREDYATKYGEAQRERQCQRRQDDPAERKRQSEATKKWTAQHGPSWAGARAQCLMCGLFFSHSMTYEWCHPGTSARSKCLDPSERGLVARPRRNDSVVWGWPRGGQNAAQREIRRKRRAG